MTNQDNSVPEVPLKEIFAAMHPSTHLKMVEMIRDTQATHVALLRTQEITSAPPPDQVICIGPGRTIRAPEDLKRGTVIGDLPSQRRVPVMFAKADNPEACVVPWSDPRLLSEAQKEKYPAPKPDGVVISDAHATVAWLREKAVVKLADLAPVLVTLGGNLYGGAHYRDVERDNAEAFLLRGRRPRAGKSPDKCYYQCPGDNADWYVGCYRDQPGPNGEPVDFLLSRWHVVKDPESRPDDYEKPKKREPFKWTALKLQPAITS